MVPSIFEQLPAALLAVLHLRQPAPPYYINEHTQAQRGPSKPAALVHELL